MKADINGIVLEGTPKEIMEILKMRKDSPASRPSKQSPYQNGWWSIFPPPDTRTDSVSVDSTNVDIYTIN